MRMHIRIVLAAALVATGLGCNSGSGDDSGTGGGTGGGTAAFQQPAGTVAVNFTIDDSANKVFTVVDGGYSDLRWQGSFIYNQATRKATYDVAWGDGDKNVAVPLYDDGPWTTGGHEPPANVAGDHKWGATVFFTPPATASQEYSYGAIDWSTGGKTGGWLWRGDSGKFTVNAGATAAINAAGLILLPYGTTDLKLVVDTTALGVHTLPDGGTVAWDFSTLKVKGSKWGWVEAPIYDDGTHGDATASDQKYTFVLSDVAGVGKLVPHAGLLSSGDSAEFVYLFGGVEDKGTVGKTAYLKVDGGTFTAQAVTTGNGNPQVVVP